MHTTPPFLRSALRLALLSLVPACGSERPEAPSALLITLDTTIPEALSCYGFVKGTTPNLDRVAAEGVRYTRARSVAPMTMPAHASMLTGLYPLRHSVRINGTMVLPDAARTLAERAGEAGYDTAAFIAAVVLDAEMGLDQGFDVYDHPRTPGSVGEHLESRRNAAEVVDRTLAWLADRDRSRPYFLWVHFFDPHFPYRAPEAYVRAANGNAYYAAVAAMDHEIGRLLAAMEEQGELDNALTLVVGDHGEALGRHGEATHMAFGFDSTLAVPFLIRFPDGRRAGSVSDAIVSVVDVQPTVIDVLGLGTPGDVDGHSLAERDPPADRGVYFETYYGFHAFGWSPLAGWADADGKYVWASSPEFYAVGEDPEETRNVVDGVDVEPYRSALQDLAARPRLDPEGLGEAFGGLRGQIEKLGYVGVGAPAADMPDPLVPSSAPSPHRRIRAFADFMEARRLSSEKQAGPAIELLRPLVTENPRHHQAAFLLGLNLMELGRYEEAIQPLRQSIEHRGRARNGADLNLALCYERIGRIDDAIRQYEAYLADTDGPPGALEIFAALLEREGRTERAAEVRRRIIERDAASRSGGEAGGSAR